MIIFDIIKRIKASRFQKNLFKELNIGDMVWAKMPLNDSELKKIESSHRTRPYLVVKKGFINIYAFSSSSKRSVCLNNYETYVINKDKYENTNNKYSWLNLKEINKVPINNLIKKMHSLNDDDLAMIEKRLQIQKEHQKRIRKRFNLYFDINEGDIIYYDKAKYYVYSKDKNNLTCYRLSQKLHEEFGSPNRVKINRKLIYIYLDNKIALDKSIDLKIIDIASNEEIINISQLRKKIRTNNKDKKDVVIKNDINIGSIFKIKNKEIMYLYEKNGICYGIDLLIYKIFPRIISIYDINSIELIRVENRDNVNTIIKYMRHNMKKPSKEIIKLYNNINSPIGSCWDEFEKEYYTPEEIEESDKNVEIISRNLHNIVM